MVNPKKARIEVHTIPESSLICPNDSTCLKAPVILELPRNQNDFHLVVKNDSTRKDITLNSKVYKAFHFGNLCFAGNHPAANQGVFSPDREIYGYDDPVLVDLTCETPSCEKWERSRKGHWYARATFPFYNYTGFDNGLGFRNYEAYLGLTTGLDYYHSRRAFFSLSGGATGISDMEFPVADRWFDTAEFVKSYCLKLVHNHNIYLFSSENLELTFGYGLQCTHFTYRLVANDDDHESTEVYKSTRTTVGLCLDAGFVLLRYGFVRFNFLPSCYTLNTHKWEYSLLGYVDAGARIPIGRDKPKRYRIILDKL